MPDLTPEALLDRRIGADPASPLITFYDDATGERAELSGKSLGNWVAKTHFLLTDGLGLGVGEKACLRLPVHWLAAPILFGCWFAGLEVVSDPAGSDVLFADADNLADLGETPGLPDERFAVSLLSMARSGEPPRGAEDYAASVRPQPDAWASVRAQATPSTPALDGLDRSGLAALATSRAAELGLAENGRLLWSTPDFGPDAWITTLLAPLAVGGSVVLVRNADAARLADTGTSERVTVLR